MSSSPPYGVILPIYHGSVQRQYDGTLGPVLHLFTKSTPQLSFTLSTHSLGKQVYNVFNIRTYSYTQNSTLLFQMVKKNQSQVLGCWYGKYMILITQSITFPIELTRSIKLRRSGSTWCGQSTRTHGVVSWKI